MARIEFGMSLPKQKIVRTLIAERDRAIQETNEALAELAQAFSAGLTVPTGGRWSFWGAEDGKISLVYDPPDPAEAPAPAGPGAEPSAKAPRDHQRRRAAARPPQTLREPDTGASR